MREKTVRTILRSLDDAFRYYGLPMLKQTQKDISRFMKLGKEPPESLMAGGATVGIVVAAEEQLRKMPEPSTEELKEFCSPTWILPHLRSLAFGYAKKLPKPPGGRPRTLSQQAAKQACREIGELLGDGVRLRDAQVRAALRHGVSFRTIQRAWQANRRARKPQEPAS